MLTLLVLLTLFMFGACLVAVVAGLITIAPALLLLFALPIIDILVIKLIFRKKKKD